MSTKLVIISHDPDFKTRIKLFLRDLGYDYAEQNPDDNVLRNEIQQADTQLYILQLKTVSLNADLQSYVRIAQQLERPFILVSEMNDPEILAVFQETSTFGYLRDPFSKEDLHFCIEMTRFRSQREMNLRLLNQRLETEIDERRKIEKELAAVQAKLEKQNAELTKLYHAIEQSAEVIVITDSLGNIEYANPSFFKVTGYSLDEVFGKNPRFLQSGYHEKEYYVRLWNTINSGNVWKGEFLNRRKDGNLYWEQASISPVLDTDGSIRHYIAVKEDITERKRSEKILEESARKLKELNASKDKFFSIMAHDIKNPLSAMIGYSDFLTQNYHNVGEDSRFKAVAGINTASKQLLNLLENLLEWSRSQLGLMKYKPEKWVFRPMVDSCFDLLKNQAESNHIRMILDDSNMDTTVLADANMVTIILRNLISNAIKFAADSGQVIVSASPQGEWLKISIQDDGMGIEEAHLPKLFRIDVSPAILSSQKQKGTGLGLIICKDFVEKNGGEIWAESTVGKGSTFYFTLKIAQ